MKPATAGSTAAILFAVRQAADILCDRWGLMLIAALSGGTRRFGDLCSETGIAARLVSVRLRRLETEAILIRLPYSLRPLRHDYRLTPSGEALLPVLLEMLRWQARWHPGVPPPAGLLPSSLRLRAVMACAACGQPTSARDIDLRISRAATMVLPEKQRHQRRSTLASGAGLAMPWLAHSFDIFGDKWGIEILLCAFLRLRRFGEFCTATGIAPNILSDRLRRLQQLDLLTANAESYWLTPQGLDLYGVLVAIQHWADHWVVTRSKAPIRLLHRSCGHAFLPLAVETPQTGVATK